MTLLKIDRGRDFSGGDRWRWGTPASVFDPLHAAFDFDLDLCADEGTTLLARWTDDVFGEVEPFRAGWMNPPYSAPGRPPGSRGTGAFVDRCAELASLHGALTVALVPSSTDALWWRRAERRAAMTLLLRRLAFRRPDGTVGGLSPTGISAFVFGAGRVRLGIYPWHPPEPLPEAVAVLARGRRLTRRA